jgi:hypothetical protein
MGNEAVQSGNPVAVERSEQQCFGMRVPDDMLHKLLGHVRVSKDLLLQAKTLLSQSRIAKIDSSYLEGHLRRHVIGRR